jgi:Ca-activated chloride channel family protein
MKQIADDTGGSFFTAQSSNQLKKVYDDIQGRVGFHLEPREILRWFIALALVALFLGVLVSLVWTGRFL